MGKRCFPRRILFRESAARKNPPRAMKPARSDASRSIAPRAAENPTAGAMKPARSRASASIAPAHPNPDDGRRCKSPLKVALPLPSRPHAAENPTAGAVKLAQSGASASVVPPRIHPLTAGDAKAGPKRRACPCPAPARPTPDGRRCEARPKPRFSLRRAPRHRIGEAYPQTAAERSQPGVFAPENEPPLCVRCAKRRFHAKGTCEGPRRQLRPCRPPGGEIRALNASPGRLRPPYRRQVRADGAPGSGKTARYARRPPARGAQAR